MGDFNACVDDENMKDFCSSYCLKSLKHKKIKQPTWFKNLENPSCIDLILTNKPQSFHSTCVIETRLSDFHKMTVSVLKMHFRQLRPKVISYRGFKKFERFMDSPYLALNIQNIYYTKNPDLFFNVYQNELNHRAPREKKYIRGNNKPFMTKTLSKFIMEKKRFIKFFFVKNPTNENRDKKTFAHLFSEKKKSNILQN